MLRVEAISKHYETSEVRTHALSDVSLTVGEGEFVAIWSMDADPIEDVDRLAASLVHEMFHCHQFTCGETRFPSDLALLADPGDARSFEAKHAENLLLADACEQKSLSCLKRFAKIRGERRKVHPDMVEQELKVETIEGMAEYVSMRALARSCCTSRASRAWACTRFL